MLSCNPTTTTTTCGEAELNEAAAVQFSPDISRLTCQFQDKEGNLLLSANKQLLEFFSTDQSHSILKLEISRILQNPIISIAGSKPMQLRVKALNQSNEAEVHVFEFSDTISASDAANNMRANIVTGIVACKIRSVEDNTNPLQTKEKIQKPYQCQSCDKRFKNQNGLEYHLSKAATMCNPNFNPKVAPGKRGRKRRKYTPEAVREESQSGPTLSQSTILPQNNHGNSNDDSESSNESGTSSSSEDSIIEWAMQNSTSGVERPRNNRVIESSPRSMKKIQASFRALPREAAVLSDIVEELFMRTPEVKLTSPKVKIADIIPTFADQVSLTGTLNLARYELLLLSIIKENHNIFPGDKSLWVACISVWLKQNLEASSSSSLIRAPESKVCSQVIDNLVRSRKLKKHNTMLKDKSGRQVTRYFVTISGAKMNLTHVKEVETFMKEAYPDYYVPLQFSPPENVLIKLRGLFNRPTSNFITPQKLEKNVQLNIPSESDKLDPDQNNARNDNVKTTKSGNETNDKCIKSKTLLTKKSSDESRKNRNAKISEGLKRYHQSLGKPPKTRKEMNKQKPRDVANIESIDVLTCDQPSDPFFCLPNSELGTGSQVLLKSTERANSKFDFSRLLLEPVTYMQEAAGSWSFQIPSHGLTPIHLSFRNFSGTKHSLVLSRQKPESTLATASQQEKNLIYNVPYNSLAKRQKIGIKGSVKLKSPTKSICQPILGGDEGTEEISSYLSGITSVSELAKRYNTGQKFYVDSESQSEDDIPDLPNPSVNPSSSAPSTAGPSEVDILSLYEPKKRSKDTSHNPGIETLPSSFGLLSLTHDSTTQVDLANSNENIVPEILIPNVIDSECNFDNGSWTVTDLILYKSEKYNVRFDCQTAFNIETLPYRELCFALNIEKTVPVTPYNLAQQQSKTAIRRKQNNNFKRLKFTRLLTHLNADFWGIGCRPETSSKFLGIPIAAGDEIAKLRKRNSHDSMSLMVEKRFIIAVVVIRALTGGIECLTDWVLVSLLFPRFSLNFIRGHWKQLVIRHKKAIDRLEIDFQDAFIKAYEAGKISTIDYDNLQEYKWNELIDWTINTVDTSFSHKPVSIPNSRTELRDRYSIEILDTKDSWRDKWFETNAATYKRLDYACFNSLSIPIRKKAKSKTEDGYAELTVAKSWIRAMALTPNDQSSVEASQKFGKKISQQALSELIRNKVIMFRSKKRVNLSSRDYEATEMFSRPLRREVKPKCFRDASVFKRYLDSEFKSGKKCVRVDYLAWEGDVMVISNLQAHKRIDLVAIDVPREKFGLTEGGYETKKIPRERLRFEMDIYPTSRYVHDDENEVILKALNDGPPRGSQLALPVWYSASETVIRTLWKEIYSAMSQVMALRAGVDIEELTRIFTPTMEEWEIKLLVSWGERLGLFSRLNESIDGWIAGEWWWAYAMALHAEDRFTVGQDVRYEPKNPFTMDGRRSG
ncbi:putative tfiiic transcription initiation factor complex subunits tfc3 [Golovinomyces cichoracearum]|uniref:Putative tfiiic transcription initiation factor complex subunits tfc3 n=1 Tax=Golovinomyces cichoracearum TaxID=62708 RepID=A0A420IBR6_9PEZI|nr:putative tfiiic transcription initiation factor complex subunits tfc3 [Golovinomyces cichoracearum]